jgi:alpha-L-rhamnosidase
MTRHLTAGALVFLFLSLPGRQANADCCLRVDHLRCEYRHDPLGIDATSPRLSWELDSDQNGAGQTAYQIVAAGDPQSLAGGGAELWDSGKVVSDQTINIEYAGTPLHSGQAVYWKVRVWDQNSSASAWSAPAMWSMGLLDPADWQGQWITSPDISIGHARTNDGFSSQPTKDQNAAKWVAIDLGRSMPIDGIRLYPIEHDRWFPLRFTVSVGDHADFSDAKVALDETGRDVTPPICNRAEFRFADVAGRYVRLAVSKLGSLDAPRPPLYALALAEMEVLSGGKNVARGCAVTASDSIDTTITNRKFLVDGERVFTAPYGPAQLGEPAPCLRKSFTIAAPILRATAYVTARGLYEFRLNGQRVGDQQLAPGWTEYNKRIPYQTYDVTSLLRPGENVAGATLGVGWYAGPVGALAPRARELYGPYAQLLAHIDVETTDGKKATIVTDGSWRSSIDGPMRFAEIYDGCVYDAAREMPGWDAAGFDDSAWKPADARPLDGVKLVAQSCDPIRVMAEIKPASLTEPRPGVYLFDMGQNMVGWCRLKVRGAADAFITVRHAEDLGADGLIRTLNLFYAKATDTYYVATNGEQTLEPKFTYHGFRYVQIEGLPARPSRDDLTGLVVHTDAPEVSSFQCSSDLANTLMRCILWTQRGNVMSIPTDCPQRSERLGWMGDIQTYSQTSTYFMDMEAFLEKWMVDIRDAQFDNGAFTAISPHFHTGLRNKPIAVKPGGVYGVFAAAPAWSDAGVLIPWSLYVDYADKRLLQTHYAAACRYVDYMDRNNPQTHLFIIGRGEQYNDWLGGGVPTDLFSTVFFAASTKRVAQMSQVLGKKAEAGHYEQLFSQIRAAFNQAFVHPDGLIGSGTEPCYVLALHFGLLDEPMQKIAMQRILAILASTGHHVQTGIQTTHRLLLELSARGCHDEACRIVQLRTPPSWGYMLDRGATTIWESWDHVAAPQGSGNHFAFASVGQWLWQDIAGIAPDESAPGYAHILIAPKPGPGFTWCDAKYRSIRGWIATNWKLRDNRFTLDLTIPPGTTASVRIPTSDPHSLLVDGKLAVGGEPTDGAVTASIVSGRHTFAADLSGVPVN